MNQDEMINQNNMIKEFEELLAFFNRGSSYDLLQARQGDGWGSAWTFAACDIHAAEKAAWMLRRIDVRKVRHARRARLRVQIGDFQRVVIITTLPERVQAILRLADGCRIENVEYLQDDALTALEAAFTTASETA